MAEWSVDSYFINIGVGDGAIHLLLNDKQLHKAVLIDGGRDEGLDPLRIAVDKLRKKYKAFTFDAIVVTHWDGDHYRGLRGLITEDPGRYIQDGKTTFYCPWIASSKIKQTDGGLSFTDDRLLIDGDEVCDAVVSTNCIGYDFFTNKKHGTVKTLKDACKIDKKKPVFLCVGADKNFIDQPREAPKTTWKTGNENNASSLMAVIAWPHEAGKKYRVSLYTGGDAGETQERVLVDWLGNSTTTTLEVIKAGHHGSHFSTPEGLLDFDNALFVISAGEEYGHPSFSTLFFVCAVAAFRAQGKNKNKKLLEILATCEPYWLSKPDLSSIHFNIQTVLSYNEGSMTLAEALKTITKKDVVSEWFADSLYNMKYVNTKKHSKDKMAALDKSGSVFSNVPSWKYPQKTPSLAQMLTAYEEAEESARAVMRQKWKLYGYPAGGKTKPGDSVLVTATQGKIEREPIHSVIQRKSRKTTVVVQPKVAAPTGGRGHASYQVQDPLHKKLKTGTTTGTKTKKFGLQAFGDATKPKGSEMEEWTLGLFVIPEELELSLIWFKHCFGDSATVCYQNSGIPELILTIPGTDSTSLSFSTREAVRIEQFRESEQDVTSVQPQTEIGFDKRFNGLLFALDTANSPGLSFSQLAKLIQYTLPGWVSQLLDLVPLVPSKTPFGRSGIWYSPCYKNRKTILRLNMQTDPKSEALSKFTELLETGLGELKVTNVFVRGTCTYEASLIPTETFTLAESTLGLEAHIEWISSNPQNAKRPKFSSTVGVIFSQNGFELNVKLDKDSNIIESLIGWAQDALHPDEKTENMPKEDAVGKELQRHLKALSDRIFLHGLRLTFDNASRKFTSFQVDLEVAVPVGADNAPFIVAFRWADGTYSLDAALWNELSYGELPKAIHPYWEPIRDVTPWIDRPISTISITKLIGDNVEFPAGVPDTIDTAHLFISYGNATTRVSLEGAVSCSCTPYGSQSDEGIPTLVFNELYLGLVISYASSGKREFALRFRGGVLINLPSDYMIEDPNVNDQILLRTMLEYRKDASGNFWDIETSVRNVKIANLYQLFSRDGSNDVIMEFLSKIHITKAFVRYQYQSGEPSKLALGGTLRLGSEASFVKLTFNYSHEKGKSWAFNASLKNNVKGVPNSITVGELLQQVVDDISFLPESIRNFSVPIPRVSAVSLSLQSNKDNNFNFTLTADVEKLRLSLTYTVKANNGVVESKTGRFSVTAAQGSGDMSVGAMLTFIGKKVGEVFSIPYPPNFDTLNKTTIDEFAVEIGKEGKESSYALKDISIKVNSDLKLQLWDDPVLELDKVTLAAGYGSKIGFHFKFGAVLNIDQHPLITTIAYDTLKEVASKDDQDEKFWYISATYPGDIDLLAIGAKLAGLDLSGNLNATELPKLKAKKEDGVIIKNLNLTLQKGKSLGGSIYISADTDWGPLKHVEFAATYEAASKWGICLSMTLKNKLLDIIPSDAMKNLGEYIEVNNTVAALYVGKVNPKRAGLKRSDLPPPPESNTVGPSGTLVLGIAIATQLKMTDKFGPITKWIKKGELDIIGDISTEGVGLGVKVAKVELMYNNDTKQHDLIIDGRFDIRVGKSTSLQIGLIADMTINAPKITKDTIVMKQTGFMVNAMSAVGFQFEIQGKLRDLFGIEGLEIYGLSGKGMFSLAESGVPEEFGFTGGIRLADMDNVKGEVGVYFAQHNLLNCYFHGDLQNADMHSFINYFLKKNNLPPLAATFLDVNVRINSLTLQAAFQSMDVRQLGIKVEPGFFYELNIYMQASNFQWSGYSCVEVHLDALQFISMMSPLYFSPESKSFLSFTRGPTDPEKYPIPKPKGTVDPSMLTEGPVMYISSKNTDMPIFISSNLIFLGLKSNVQVIGDGKGFYADVQYSVDMNSIGISGNKAEFDGRVRIEPDFGVEANMHLGMTASLSLPGLSLSTNFGRSATMFRNSLDSVAFEVNFSMSGGFPNSGVGFHLNLGGKVHALGQDLNLPTLSFNFLPSDMDTAGKLIQKIIDEFLNNFTSNIKSFLINISSGEIADFFKKHFDSATEDIIVGISSIKGDSPGDIILSIGKTAFGIGNPNQAVGLLAKFDYDSTSALTVASKLFGVNAPPISPIGVGVPVSGPFAPLPLPGPIISLPNPFPFFKPGVRILPMPFQLAGISTSVASVEGMINPPEPVDPGPSPVALSREEEEHIISLIGASMKTYPQDDVHQVTGTVFSYLPQEQLGFYIDMAKQRNDEHQGSVQE